MTELPPDAQDFLALAKRAHRELPTGAKTRVRAALGSSLALSPDPSRSLSVRGVRGLMKGSWLGGAAVTLLAGAGWFALRAPSHERRDDRSAPAAAQVHSVAPATPAAIPARSSAPPTLTAPASEAPAAPSREPVRGAPRSSLRDELALLSRAEQALRDADYGSARAALSLHRQRHSKGQLREERVGLEVIVQCLAEESDAQRKALQYLASAPESALRERVQRACAVSSEEP